VAHQEAGLDGQARAAIPVLPSLGVGMDSPCGGMAATSHMSKSGRACEPVASYGLDPYLGKEVLRSNNIVAMMPSFS